SIGTVLLFLAIMIFISIDQVAAFVLPDTGQTVLVDSGSEWRYLDIEQAGWTVTSFDDSQWSIGITPFNDHSISGWCGYSAAGTNWPINTSLYLRKNIAVAQASDLTLKIAIDNDLILYFDGNEVVTIISDGCAYEWQYQYNIPAITAGVHTISVKITDRGDTSYFNLGVSQEFVSPPRSLTVTLDPQEGGTITSVPEGLICSGNTCTGSFPQGTLATLTANPINGWLFVHWDDGTICSPENPHTIVMDEDKAINAVFASAEKKTGAVIFVDGIQIFQILFDPLSIWPGNYSQYLVESIDDEDRLSFNKRNESITPFIWANTTNDTGAISRLSELLESWTRVTKITHGPLIVASHSWGTLLAYLAITNNTNVHVDKFITMGSPLNANLLVSMYSNEWLKAFDLLSLPRPSNVDKWHNYWAKCDPISASIPSADKNYKINTSYRDAWGIYPTCHGAYFEDDAVWGNILNDANKK
ncbi:MAG: hypothetical protein ABL876_18845, partial [Chitinophagaceae bacterium]